MLLGMQLNMLSFFSPSNVNLVKIFLRSAEFKITWLSPTDKDTFTCAAIRSTYNFTYISCPPSILNGTAGR